MIKESGHLNENCGEWEVRTSPLTFVFIINKKYLFHFHAILFQNIPKYTARDLILQKLQEIGLYKCTKPRVTYIPICNRSGDVIEQMLKDQW